MAEIERLEGTASDGQSRSLNSLNMRVLFGGKSSWSLSCFLWSCFGPEAVCV